jgi:hypothetical protein
MSDLSPQSGPRRTFGQVTFTNRDFMSAGPYPPLHAHAPIRLRNTPGTTPSVRVVLSGWADSVTPGKSNRGPESFDFEEAA